MGFEPWNFGFNTPAALSNRKNEYDHGHPRERTKEGI
jgi:hypothetical protein